MPRPKTATEPQGQRVAPVTFNSVAEKRAAQAHATRKGQSLAGLLKLLLAADMAADLATHPAPTPGPGGAGAA